MQSLAQKTRVLPFHIQLLLYHKHGANFKQKLIGRRLRIPFISKKYGNQYAKILIAYLQQDFLDEIESISKSILRQDGIAFREDIDGAEKIIQAISNLSKKKKDETKRNLLVRDVLKTGAVVYTLQKTIFESATEKTFGIGINLTDESVLSNLGGWAEENIRLIDKLKEEMIPKMKDYVVEAFKSGVRSKDIAEFIRRTTDYTKYRASLIATDQISKLYGQMNKQRQTDIGIIYYIWRTVGDERVRPKHRALDGNKRRWDEGVIPGEEIRCRCSGDGVLDEGLFG